MSLEPPYSKYATVFIILRARKLFLWFKIILLSAASCFLLHPPWAWRKDHSLIYFLSEDCYIPLSNFWSKNYSYSKSSCRSHFSDLRWVLLPSSGLPLIELHLSQSVKTKTLHSPQAEDLASEQTDCFMSSRLPCLLHILARCLPLFATAWHWLIFSLWSIITYSFLWSCNLVIYFCLVLIWLVISALL